MRLTLRTLLAHEHGLLDEEQAVMIAQRIEQSPFVLQLLRHLKDRAARAEIVPLAIDARGMASIEKVVCYLDYVLPAEEVVKLENECFASDRMLAEVAACHEILADWLSTPTPIDPDLRENLYDLMPGPPNSIDPDIDEIAIDLPSLAYQAVTPARPTVERKSQPETLPKRRSLLGTALQLMTLSACVMGLVAFVVTNRDHVEQMIAQHWQKKSTQAVDHETWPTDDDQQDEPAELPVDPTPERFVAQAVRLDPVIKSQTSLGEKEAITEVATTSFVSPIASGTLPAGVFRVQNSSGILYQSSPRHSWSPLEKTGFGEGRLIVALRGECELHGNGSKVMIGPASEISLATDRTLDLRYGTMDLGLSPGTKFQMRAASQDIVLTAGRKPVRIKLKTAPVNHSGIDFANDSMNQEIQVEGIEGRCEITLSSCRGPFSIEPGQKIAAHTKLGVRSDPSIVFATGRVDPAGVTRRLDWVPPGMDAIAHLQQQLNASAADVQCNAALLLAQMGEMGSLPDVWSRWEGRAEFREHARQFRLMVAQDADLASRLKATLEVQNPQYGSLIYRLVCGFSPDQLTEATSAQLEALLRHPEPVVRVWTKHQLSGAGPAANVRLSRLSVPPID